MAEHRKLGPVVPISSEQLADAHQLRWLVDAARRRPAPLPPGWRRELVAGNCSIGVRRLAWQPAGVVWCAQVPLPDGRHDVALGRRHTRWGARRAARAAVARLHAQALAEQRGAR